MPDHESPPLLADRLCSLAESQLTLLVLAILTDLAGRL